MSGIADIIQGWHKEAIGVPNGKQSFCDEQNACRSGGDVNTAAHWNVSDAIGVAHSAIGMPAKRPIEKVFRKDRSHPSITGEHAKRRADNTGTLAIT